MRELLARYPIQFVGGLIFALFLGGHTLIETWVFRTLPYLADAREIDHNLQARRITAPILKADSFFQRALGRLMHDTPHPDLVLLNIDYGVLEMHDSWPLPRSAVSDIFTKLGEHTPRMVLLDMVFEWPQTPWVLEALNRRAGEKGGEALLPLLREMNHDGQVKNALAPLEYVLIYFFARHGDVASPAQEKKYQSTMARHAVKAKVNVTGEGELDLYPVQRIIGIRDSILPLQIRAKGQGFAWVNNDRYGTAGQAPLFHRLQTTGEVPKSYYLIHSVVETARVLSGAKEYSLALDQGRSREFSFGDIRILTDPSGDMLINFYDRRLDSKIPKIKALDLLNDQIDPAVFKDKIVIVGSDVSLLHDYMETPAGKLWGTEILGYALSNILNQDYFYRPVWATNLERALLVLVFFLVQFTVHRLKPSRSILVALVIFAALAVLTGSLYVRTHQVISLVVPAGFLAVLYLQSTIMRYFYDERQKRLYKNALGLYLSPQLTSQVADNPALLSLDGKEEDLTVLFSDIRNFTTISENFTPEALTSFLQEYLSPMTDIVFDTDGTLDKYIGDAVMAFWGAPLPQENHAERGCRAALLMQEKLEELRPQWEERGLPPIKIGIGLNSGPMRVGNMGSDRRLSYTVMGDNVNLGSRLESLTKYYGVSIIVSETTWNCVQGLFHGRILDRVKVKGKLTAVAIYELIGPGEAPGQLARDLAGWQEAQDFYCARKWDEAEPLFVLWQKRYNDVTAGKYLEAIQAHRKTPPPDGWDAVSSMTSK